MLLNPSDPIDVFALHYVFAPLIQQNLNAFRDMWNVHTVRTNERRIPAELVHAAMGCVRARECVSE